MAEARRQFVKLRMHQTPERNGVLLYFAPRSRHFAIIGDDRIHQRYGQEFWDRTAAAMSGSRTNSDHADTVGEDSSLRRARTRSIAGETGQSLAAERLSRMLLESDSTGICTTDHIDSRNKD